LQLDYYHIATMLGVKRMKIMAIDWKKVAHLAIDHEIESKRELATRAGIHYNTLYNEGEFKSSTVDKLAALFGCEQTDLLTVVEADLKKVIARSNVGKFQESLVLA